ncbi:MAG: HAMP domain-containing histidine kinase, partial [Salinisphaera sp.]|nr:HAMP domain-containing histidine kinase [Salinisphaera sp.]
LARIQSTAEQVRWFMLLCVFALVPATVLLAILFTSVISRPIRQIQTAVGRLGEGEFGTMARISAPSAELDALGNQLEWLRRRLVQLESEKNQFLRHMSHELKTPLASIREGVELIRDGTLGPLSEQQAEVATILQTNSLELMALIENLLNYAAWQQQQSRLEASRFELRELAEQVVRRHQLVLDARSIAITLPAHGFQLWADRDRVRLILDNLIANAVKFSPRRGQLGIDGWQHGGYAVIEVTDEGPGVPQAEREHVFLPFYQAHEDPTAHVRGTGIGLSVVRECVRAHQGTIEVVDRAGKGAVFRLRLPGNDQQ